MLILQKQETGESFEVTWIYDRGKAGFYLRAEKASGIFSVGDKVTLGQYSPKLEKLVNTTITHVEENDINRNVCIRVKNKRDLPYFKRALVRYEV